MTVRKRRVVVGTIALSIFLPGCATLPLEAGRDRTDTLLRSRVAPQMAATVARASRQADDAAIDKDVADWLAGTLTVDAAVRVALLRNPGLQARLAGLGLSAADVFEAGRLRNPQVDVALLMPRGDAAGNKLSFGVTLGFTDLLLKRASSRIAEADFARSQADVAAAVLALVSETQRAWVDAVAAAQRVAVREAIDEVARNVAELAARYHQAGNISRLDLRLQQASATEASLSLQRARTEALAARASLQKLLGLAATQAWQLPEALPTPENQPQLSFDVLRARARVERLDLLGAQREVDALEQRLALTRGTRWLGHVEAGAGLEREGDGSRRAGPRASIELPLFQQGQGRVARDSARLEQARASRREVEVAIDVELQQQLQRIGLALAAVQGYRQELIPQREAIVDEMQRRNNQMLADSFALLQAKQQEQSAYEGYVDAVQEYWRCRVTLLQAAGTQLVAALPPAPEERQ